MEQLTVEEIINITIQNLSNILVPVGLTKQIALPIEQNIHNLNECLRVLNAGREKAEGSPVEGIFGDEQTKE